MAELNAYWTKQGFDKIWSNDASSLESSFFKIKLGANAYNVVLDGDGLATQTDLLSATLKSFDFAEYVEVSETQRQFRIVDGSTDEYDIGEMGLYIDDGTAEGMLAVVWSRFTPIHGKKYSDMRLIEVFDVNLSAVPSGNISFIVAASDGMDLIYLEQFYSRDLYLEELHLAHLKSIELIEKNKESIDVNRDSIVANGLEHQTLAADIKTEITTETDAKIEAERLLREAADEELVADGLRQDLYIEQIHLAAITE